MRSLSFISTDAISNVISYISNTFKKILIKLGTKVKILNSLSHQDCSGEQ